MKSIEKYLLILVTALLISCSPQGNSSSEIIEIDVLKALEDHRDFPLSKLISKVELLELENNKESYLGRPEIMYFGEKHILMYCSQRHLVFLFNRNGRFIRQIGQVGKGPGEYSARTMSTIDPDEKIIVVVDGFRGKIISYNMDGDFIQERQFGEDTPSYLVDGISFIGPNKFGLMMRRPNRPIDGYANVVLYDLNLNPAGRILPRANNDDLVYPMSHRASFSLNDHGAFYWESFMDTIYTIDENGSAKARYQFNITKNGLTRSFMKQNPQGTPSSAMMEYTSIMHILETPKYILASVMKNDYCPLIIDKKANEAFTTGHRTACQPEIRSWVKSSMENDLFGIEPVSLNNYWVKEKCFAYPYLSFWIESGYDLDCIRNMEVLQPEIRNRLLYLTEHPEEDATVLVIMHSK